jgi:hypothetical protein
VTVLAVGEKLAAPAAALVASVLFLLALSGQHDPLSPQSIANQHFAETASYATALSELNRAWPPLYPTLLWAVTAMGIPLGQVNALLFLGTLALLFFAGRRVAPGVHPAWAVALYAACAFNVFNLHQLVSEALFIPLTIGTLLLTRRCARTGAARDQVLLSALLAACCLTRYFALVWLVPFVGLALVVGGSSEARSRIARAAAICIGAALPLAGWMLHARATTGYLTGMERFAPRIFSEKTTLLGNLSLGGRTLFLDGFVPGTNASHAAVGPEFGADPVGLIVGGVVGIGALVLGVVCTRVALAVPSPRNTHRGVLAVLLPGLSLGYGVVLLAVWSLGNNDPIYSRFLYPCYVFFVLGGVHVYAHVKSASGASASRAARRPFQTLYALMLSSQAVGTLLTLRQAWAAGP